MNTNRPVNLNLLTIRLPITAIVSILHRITGVVLFLFIPFYLWLWHAVVSSPASFYEIVQWLQRFPGEFLLWVMLSSLSYHVLAGVRHLIMDCGFAESKQAGRAGAYSVLAITTVVVIILGVWVW